MSEWKEFKLGDLLLTANTGLDAIKRAPIVSHNTGIKCLRIQDISQSKEFDNWGFTEVTQNNFNKFKLLENDIIVARTGATVGVNLIIKENLNSVFNNGLIRLRASNIVNSKYLYFTLRSNEYWNHINSVAFGTISQPNIQINQLLDFKVNVPDLPTQIAIAEILSSLDDKIELNNKINKELETLAQTLFKQWFIDFEFPNEKGEPYKSSGGEMVDSELGEIPNGWSVGYLNQIAELHKKNIKPFENPDTIYFHYSLPEYDVSKMPKNELGDKILSSKYEVVEHSVLVSKLNPITPRIWPIFKPNKNSICSTEFQVLKPLSVQFFPFLYCLCSSKAYTSSLQSKVTGTSGSHQRVNPKDMIDFEMVLPPTTIVNNFHDFTYDSLKMIQENRQEIVKLTKLRDTLLPKLISGELEINEISN